MHFSLPKQDFEDLTPVYSEHICQTPHILDFMGIFFVIFEDLITCLKKSCMLLHCVTKIIAYGIETMTDFDFIVVFVNYPFKSMQSIWFAHFANFEGTQSNLLTVMGQYFLSFFSPVMEQRRKALLSASVALYDFWEHLGHRRMAERTPNWIF